MIFISRIQRSVTLTSKLAIGEDNHRASPRLFPIVGDPADFVVLHGVNTIQSAVLSPPLDRTTIHAGIVVARRQTSSWLLLDNKYEAMNH